MRNAQTGLNPAQAAEAAGFFPSGRARRTPQSLENSRCTSFFTGMRAVRRRAIPYTHLRTRYTHQASAGALRMRAMSHSARTIFVTSSLVLVTCLGAQTALAQTAQTTSSFGAPVASSTEQAPRESQASQSLGQIPRLSPPQEPNFFKSTLTDFKHLG